MQGRDHPSAAPEDAPEVLWRPHPEAVERSQMAAFRRWLRAERDLDLAGYDALWTWSVAEPEAFWDAVAAFFDVTFHDRPERVLGERVMPGTRWFPG
ncbi:MAG: acetyl-coenzyme A synthetase N-terminal domain-containing protein, partial [Jiangellaceae bacterium]